MSHFRVKHKFELYTLVSNEKSQLRSLKSRTRSRTNTQLLSLKSYRLKETIENVLTAKSHG